MIEQREMALREQRNKIKNTAKRMIWVSFKKPTDKEHDASFHFRVGIQVFHNVRDLEFIQVKRWLENQYDAGILELNHESSEMIADDLYEVIASRYPNRDITVSISENGEDGCEIFYTTQN